MTKIKSIRSDPRWPAFVAKYRYDWVRFAVEVIGLEPTHQQRLLMSEVQEPGCRVSCVSGHGTGKSSSTAIMILCFELCFIKARTVVIANNSRQVQIGIWKNLRDYWNEATKRFPWLAQYYVLTETQFFEKSCKTSWSVSAKSCRLGHEEALAGEHSKYLLNVIDEASGVNDKAHGIIGGSCTEADNRILMLSQPTRPSGFFYDTHHLLSKPLGRWTSIVLNSEESPLVTDEFILEKIQQYGGRNSSEYLIKVRGEFPKQSSEFLLSRDDCDRATRVKVKLDDDWGYVALCDVGNGRDKSIINICKISGNRQNRKLVSVKLKEMDGNIDPVRFGDYIFAECSTGLYPNITAVIDSDGVGYDTATICERHGMRVQRIRWGKPLHSTADKKRFLNERAYANISARDAVKQGRMKLDKNIKTAEQAAKIPVSLTETGQWACMPKKIMREKMNIKSPDRWDTYCFGMLANYIPANIVVTQEMMETRSVVEDWVNQIDEDEYV